MIRRLDKVQAIDTSRKRRIIKTDVYVSDMMGKIRISTEEYVTCLELTRAEGKALAAMILEKVREMPEERVVDHRQIVIGDFIADMTGEEQ